MYFTAYSMKNGGWEVHTTAACLHARRAAKPTGTNELVLVLSQRSSTRWVPASARSRGFAENFLGLETAGSSLHCESENGS